MYRKSFPACTLPGDQHPSPMQNHLGLAFSVPNKCLGCEHLFEGECTRSMDWVAGYLRLDYGACGIAGDTQPAVIEKTDAGNEVVVPQKCLSCAYLHKDSIREYVCKKDQDLWGAAFRDLDWGDWTPDYPMVGVRRVQDQMDLGQAVITREIVMLLQAGKRTAALKMYRKLNQIETLKEALTEIEKLEAKLKAIEL